MGKEIPPFSFTSFATALAFSWKISPITTSPPHSANAFANSFPIPLPPPVINIVFLLKSKAFLYITFLSIMFYHHPS